MRGSCGAPGGVEDKTYEDCRNHQGIRDDSTQQSRPRKVELKQRLEETRALERISEGRIKTFQNTIFICNEMIKLLQEQSNI